MTPPETTADLLTRLAHARFGSKHGFQRRFSEAAGVPEPLVSKALKGASDPTIGTLRKMAVALGVPLVALTDPGLLGRLPAPIPVLGDLGAGPPCNAPSDARLNVTDLFPEDAVAYRVRGRSMEAELIADGDYVVVLPTPVPAGGTTVVAWVDTPGGWVLKNYDGRGRLTSGRGKDRWMHTIQGGDVIVGAYVGLVRRA